MPGGLPGGGGGMIAFGIDPDITHDSHFLLLSVTILCSSRKNPYPPHGRSLEIPRGGGGGLKSQNFRSKVQS